MNNRTSMKKSISHWHKKKSHTVQNIKIIDGHRNVVYAKERNLMQNSDKSN